MADTLVVRVGLEVAAVLDVIEILDVVLLGHLPAGAQHSTAHLDSQ